ncbi:SMP-30/gluconolactonase/LRE family protein [Confluentibacter citreus]|uniref:ATP/GTP-binding protein n=1 Tax=Confluentibacter citreus TaxID=2007307 RepID=UPI000C288C6B|nr:ATP/GTP-binding protein [Confluentibacter citreus]
MNKYISVAAIFIMMFQMGHSQSKQTEMSLTKLWETDTILKTAEAVRYHPEKDIIYVSNIGDVPPNKKDGDGYISLLSKDGKIVKKDWITGIHAPKGLNFFNGKLFVGDIDTVVEINIETGKIEKTHTVTDAVFINDLDIDTNGDIYVTDSQDEKIFKIVNGESSLWLDAKGFYPNGILVEENRILILSSSKGELIAIDKITKEKTVLALGVRGGDGIVPINEGYILSAFQGEIYFADKNLINMPAVKLLDTRANKLNTADMSFIPKENVLLVPTFYGNTVVAYKLNYK